MRFVIQIEGIVISVRTGPVVMPRSSQKTASHLVPPSPLPRPRPRRRRCRCRPLPFLSKPPPCLSAFLRAVRVIERVVGRLHTEVRHLVYSRIVPHNEASRSLANRAAIS